MIEGQINGENLNHLKLDRALLLSQQNTPSQEESSEKATTASINSNE
jgi:hypothetical protein